MESLSRSWTFKGCSSSCKGSWSFSATLQYVKLPTTLDLISARVEKTFPECAIWTGITKFGGDRKWFGLTVVEQKVKEAYSGVGRGTLAGGREDHWATWSSGLLQ